MRRALKIAGVVVAVLVGVLGAGALYIECSGIPHYAVGHVSLHVTPSPERIERGKKLASLLCVDCHLDPRTGRLTGRRMFDVPKKFGVVFSTNITRDPVKGIGAWTDGEIAYLVRTGVARDGQYTPPWMVKLPHMSDDDLQAVIAYLRSDDPLVAPMAVDPPGQSDPSFLTKLLCRFAFRALPYPRQPVVAPPITDRVAHGRYLIAALDCYGCHSASFEKTDIMEPERSKGYLGGGNEVIDPRGRTIYSSNITPDDATGIGRWTEADLARALREGFRPDGAPLRAPMAPMPQLTDDEVVAIYAYLRTVPAIRNHVERTRDLEGVAASASEGKRLYYKYACAACHGDDGAHGSVDLTLAAQHFPAPGQLEAWIRDAPSIKPDTRMPRWKGVIAEDEYDPLVAYVRGLGRVSRR